MGHQTALVGIKFLSEQRNNLTVKEIYDALSITDNLLLKLDCIDQALNKYEQDLNDIALNINRTYHY